MTLDLSNTNDIVMLKRLISQVADERIAVQTKNCVRQSIGVVSTLPSNGKVGITQGFSEEIKLSYISTLSFSIGDNVVIEWFGSGANMFVSRKAGVF